MRLGLPLTPIVGRALRARPIGRAVLLVLLACLALLAGSPPTLAHNPAIGTIVVPAAPAPALDGVCGASEYADAGSVIFTSRYSTSAFPVRVFFKRDPSNLYVCFRGMPRGDAAPGDFAALYLDRDHDGGRFARFDDYQLTIGQSGAVVGRAGDNAGGYTGPNPGGWTAQRSVGEFTWDAEFRVSEGAVGGWGHLVGISFAHHWVRSVGDDYAWPSGWSWNSPDTWAHFGLYRTSVLVPEGTTPTLDGACGTTEYQDAGRTSFVSRYATSSFTVDVFLKHDWANVYVCVRGLPRGDASPGDMVSLYLDRDHDAGSRPRPGDYRLRMSRSGVTSGATGDGTSFGGPNPGNWTAQRKEGEFLWDAEFQVARDLVGGWGHTIGLSLWHQSVRSAGDDYGWPPFAAANVPSTWGDAVLDVPSISVGAGGAPTLDGACGASEYAGATPVQFISRYAATPFPVTVYLKHSGADLYVCFTGLPRGDTAPGDFATVYLDRDRDRAAQAEAGDFAFSIRQNGTTTGGSGDGLFGYSGPDPGGWTARRSLGEFTWSAEFRIGRAIVGGWGRTVGLALFHHWVRAVGDDYHWPAGALWNAPNSWAHVSLLTTSAATENDLQITGVEVTQSIQDLSNSAPLVAGKRTTVRVHVRADRQATPGVTARLYARRGGVDLGPGILPSNPNGITTALTAPDRGQLGDSFYFDLPHTWVQAGAVALEARINPERTVGERDFGNNSQTALVTFETTPPLRLKLVAVRYSAGGNTYVASTFHQNMLLSWLNRAYPVPYVQTTVVTRDFPADRGQPTSDKVNSWLSQIRTLDLASGGDARTVYYGLVDDGGGFMRGAAAGIPSSIASGPTGSATFGWDTDGSYGDWYGGHEIGHTRGRKHPGFGDSCDGTQGRDDPGYPYPQGFIGRTDALDFYGFDSGDGARSITPAVFSPNLWTDMMTYRCNQWISDYTYKSIRDHLVSRETAAASAAAVGEFLAVSGEVNLSRNTASLGALYRLVDPAGVPERIPGDHVIRLVGAGETTLADYAFTPRLSSDPDPGDLIGLVDEVVPWVAGTSRVAIVRAGTELASRAVSANAPTVSILAPNGGENVTAGSVTMRWFASDADGGPLTFAVQYSRDAGATWTTLAAGLSSSELSVPVQDLPGSNRALIRVLASDGVNTGQDRSDATFQVSGKPPAPTILSPGNNSVFVQGQTVILQGSATDVEDGTLLDAALRWSSSLDGDLGPGALTSAILSAGTHVLTLTATDSNGASAAVQATVTVQMEAAPRTRLVIAPARLTFSTPVGTTPPDQILTIRDGAGGELPWTAESDQPWLALQPTSGGAPASLVASVLSSGMAPGTYTAQVTIQSGPGVEESPRSVDVVLTVAPDVRFRQYLPVTLLGPL